MGIMPIRGNKKRRGSSHDVLLRIAGQGFVLLAACIAYQDLVRRTTPATLAPAAYGSDYSYEQVRSEDYSADLENFDIDSAYRSASMYDSEHHSDYDSEHHSDYDSEHYGGPGSSYDPYEPWLVLRWKEGQSELALEAFQNLVGTHLKVDPNDILLEATAGEHRLQLFRVFRSVDDGIPWSDKWRGTLDDSELQSTAPELAAHLDTQFPAQLNSNICTDISVQSYASENETDQATKDHLEAELRELFGTRLDSCRDAYTAACKKWESRYSDDRYEMHQDPTLMDHDGDYGAYNLEFPGEM